MRRARETAEVIAAKLAAAAAAAERPGVPTDQDPLLAEGVPAMPLPPSTVFKPTQETVDKDSKRIEEAFRRYFYRAAGPDQQQQQQQLLLQQQQQQQEAAAANSKVSTSGSNSASSSSSSSSSKPPTEEYSIIVCHGNVIRYFFCRALQLPRCAWLRLAAANCSISWLSVDSRGFVSA
ncbi:phosphoglycerate mutase family protein, putative, partial [Eimeria necatrix]